MEFKLLNDYFDVFARNIPAIPLKFKNNVETKTIENLLDTAYYILQTYGECLYVKIIDGRIVRYQPLTNPSFMNKWQKTEQAYQGHIEIKEEYLSLDWNAIHSYPRNKNIQPLIDVLNLVCEKFEIPDCDLLFNTSKNTPMITKDRTFADKPIFGNHIVLDWDAPIISYPVFSTFSNEDYKDFVFPSLEDLERMESSFGIVNSRNMIWNVKEKNVLIIVSNSNQDAESIVEYARTNQLEYTIVPDDKVQWIVSSNSRIETKAPMNPEGILKDGFDPNSNDIIKNYKYIICFEDLYFPTLLFSASCIFKKKSLFKTWYSDSLNEGQDFISFSRIEEVQKIISDSQIDFEKVGANGRMFAIKNLARENILEFIKTNLENFVNCDYDSSKIPISSIQAEFQRISLEEYRKRFSDLPKLETIRSLKYDRLKHNKVLHLAFQTSPWTLNPMSRYRTTKTYSSQVEGMNDAYIGIRVINSLAEEIPNFCYTLDYSINQKSNYVDVYTENLNGVMLEDFLRDHPSKFNELFLQICSALEVAWQRFGFVHGNLTTKNIIVLKLEEAQRITYRKHDSQSAIVTKYIPVIFNYSKSSCLAPEFGSAKEFNTFFSNKKIIIGNMDDEKINELLHGSKDSKTLLKSLGKSIKETKPFKSPEDVMKAVVKKSDITDNKIKYGNVKQESWTDAPKHSNTRNEYDKLRGVIESSSSNNVIERVFNNPFPVGKSKLENTILKYEMMNNISSAFNVSANIEIKTNNNISRALEIIKRFYDDIITTSPDLDFTSENWDVKVLASRYYKTLSEHPSTIAFLESMKDITASTINKVIVASLDATRDFYKTRRI